MREKLFELLLHASEPCLNTNCGVCKYEDCDDCGTLSIVDNLIANGVTIPEWISVNERLPELHTKVLCCGIKGGRFIAELGTWGHEKHLYWDKKNGQGSPTVAHWMPLPEPPKGEK